jgi:aspartyl-tRNA synthetase
MLTRLPATLARNTQSGSFCSPHLRPAGIEPAMEAAMTHVYYHCTSADEIYLDRRGIEVEDLVEAHQRAAQIVKEFINSHGPYDWRTWTLHVSDEDGEELFLVPFSYMLGKPH